MYHIVLLRGGILELWLPNCYNIVILQEVHCRLTEAAESEARVTDLNVDLSQQISELLHQQNHQ